MRLAAVTVLLGISIVGVGAAPLHAQPAAGASADDPYEASNRRSYATEASLDRGLFGPLAKLYHALTPGPIGVGIHNVLSNLSEPVVIINDVLQGRFKRAGRETLRMTANTTAGFIGLMDVATPAGLPRQDTDFGITLGRWGVKPGPYLYLPLIGPTTPRDLLGLGADTAMDPLNFISYPDRVAVAVGKTVIGGLDLRYTSQAQLDALLGDAEDPYATLRSVYLQNREAQVTGEDEAPALAPLDVPPDTTPAAPAQPIRPHRRRRPLRNRRRPSRRRRQRPPPPSIRSRPWTIPTATRRWPPPATGDRRWRPPPASTGRRLEAGPQVSDAPARQPVVARLVGVCTRQAPLVLLAGLALVAAAVFFVATHFSINTDTTALLSPKLAYRVREVAFAKLFPQSANLIVVVVDGKTPELAEGAAAALSDKLTADPALFSIVRRPDGGPFWSQEGLLFAPTADVKTDMDRLITAQPFLGPMAADPSLRGLMGALSTALQGVGAGQATLSAMRTPIARWPTPWSVSARARAPGSPGAP